VHGFDLTFCAPKSVSLVRALRTDDVVAKAIASGYTTALSEAMKYLAAHAGYTRVHNPHTRRKTSCAFLVWWTSPTSTRPHAAGTRTCTSCSAEAASTRCHLFRAIVANDGHLMTAHGIAATTAYEVRSSRVRGGADHRGAVIRIRAAEYEHWRVALDTFEHAMRQARDRGLDGIASYRRAVRP